MRSMTADELLTTTRAVRRRLDLERPVEDKVIEDCLGLALQAPTGGGRQEWRWLVVMGAETRSALADIYRAAAKEMFELRLATATDDASRKVYAGALHLAEILDRVPVLVLPCIQGRVDDGSSRSAASLYGSIIPAIWSFQLALRSRGLGSTYTTAHLRQEAAVARLLGIPADVTQVALLPVAYTRGQDFKPASRKPVKEVAFLDRWGSGWQS